MDYGHFRLEFKVLLVLFLVVMQELVLQLVIPNLVVFNLEATPMLGEEVILV